ncbi:dual CXXC motif small (seleno)protein [Desulfoplanes formicivorans]
MLHCTACGAQYQLSQYGRMIEEDMEDFLGDVPCDRL